MPSAAKTKPAGATRRKNAAKRKGKRAATRKLAIPHARTSVDDALRAAGLGELRLAETFGIFIERVSDKKGQEKLLLDGLKEWGRQFERTRTAERAAGDPPVFVHLIHNVPRPERLPTQKIPQLPPPTDIQAPPSAAETDVQ